MREKRNWKEVNWKECSQNGNLQFKKLKAWDFLCYKFVILYEDETDLGEMLGLAKH